MQTHFWIIFGASLGISLLLTPLVRKIALATGKIAVPKEDRWHQKKTALLGGISIFCAVSFVWAGSAFLIGWQQYGRPCLPLMLCAAAVFLLGLLDDLRGLDPQNKLAGQIIIAAILMFFGFRLGWTDSKTINLFLSILWVVGITNAFNLLDNMDGLSAGIAFVAGSFIVLNLYLTSGYASFANPLPVVAAAYLGAVLGFLVYNFNPASIFMGDAGSLFIGFVLAGLTLQGWAPHRAGGDFMHLVSVISIPILILFIPILDTGFVSLMRKLFRRPISEGGRDHSSHRMVAIGFSERKAVLVLYAFSAISGLLALGVNRMRPGISLVVIVFYLLFVMFFWIYLGKVKVYSEKSLLERRSSGILTPILVEITYRRRLLEVLLDLVLITVAYYTAYLLRFEGVLGPNFDFFLKSLPLLIACQILCFHALGVYQGVWESAGVRDLTGYIKAVTAGTVLSILILLGLYRFISFSRAVFAIYWGLMLILVSLSRLSFRLLQESVRKVNQEGKAALIYGAGIGGQMLVREIETDQRLGLRLVGFVDDDFRMHRRKIKGYPILGGQQDLPQVIKKHGIEEIIVAFKERGAEKRKEIEDMCIENEFTVAVKQMRLLIT